MERINIRLKIAQEEFRKNSELVTQNSTGRANFTAWGALDYISAAFNKLPAEKSKYNEAQ
jgi:hypothetical protein